MPSAGDRPPAAEASPWQGQRRKGGLGRWLKPVVTIALYVLVFYWTDASAILSRLGTAHPGLLLGGVALYALGQAISAFKWWLLLKPVRLKTSYPRLLGYYFCGMFFNLFLPTIVGGDAVKALLLARETGAPARSTMSVFMERDTGLGALLILALVAAYLAPPVAIGGVSLIVLTWLLALGYAGANIVLSSPVAYRLADRLIAATPLARMRPRTAALYEAITPYKSAPGTLMLSVVLSLFFQILVVAVVFLNARALSLAIPLSAVTVFVPLISLAGMVPVSVNGLGVREALYILLFGQVGVGAELAVSLALLYLAVTLLASLPGGLVYALQKSPAPLSPGEAAPDLH
jgi:glycosyltransferase 2 family protein